MGKGFGGQAGQVMTMTGHQSRPHYLNRKRQLDERAHCPCPIIYLFILIFERILKINIFHK